LRFVEEASRNHQDAPRGGIPKDTPDFALKFDGTAAKLGAEFTRKCSQAPITDFKAGFGYGAFRGQHLPGTVHPQTGEKVMWSFAEGSAEQTMEMKFREASFAGRLLKQNPGLVLRGEEIASAAEPSKSVVMEERRHSRNNTTGKKKSSGSKVGRRRGEENDSVSRGEEQVVCQWCGVANRTFSFREMGCVQKRSEHQAR